MYWNGSGDGELDIGEIGWWWNNGYASTDVCTLQRHKMAVNGLEYLDCTGKTEIGSAVLQQKAYFINWHTL